MLSRFVCDKHNIEFDEDFRWEVEAKLCSNRLNIDQPEIGYESFDFNIMHKIIMKLKSRKVPGWDKITAEHLKYCGLIATAAITWLINSITGIE